MSVLWVPTDLTNQIAWYISDAPGNTLSSGLTTALADQSGNGWTASTAGAGANMTNTLNGRPVLRTSGSNIFKSDAAGDGIARSSGAVSFFVVHRAISYDGASYPAIAAASFGSGSSTLQTAVLRSETGWSAGSINLRTRPTTGQPGLEIGDNTDYGTNWLIVGTSRQYDQDDGYLRVNGTQTASGTMDSDGITQDTAMSIVIGNYNTDGGDQWTQDIAEVIAVKNDIALSDREKLEGYLAWQWGLEGSLPVGHPYKNSAPTVPSVENADITETVTADSLENGVFVLSASIDESTTANDLVSSVKSTDSAISEILIAGSAEASTLITTVSTLEDINATDGISSVVITGSSIIEHVTADSTSDSTRTFAVSINENNSVEDNQSSTQGFNSSISEIANAIDFEDRIIEIQASISESALITDNQAVQLVIAVDIDEDVNAISAEASTFEIGATVTENINATSNESVSALIATSILEEAIASTSQSINSGNDADITESIIAIDASDATILVDNSINEQVTATDSVSVSVFRSTTIVEDINATDANSAIASTSVSINEPASATDIESVFRTIISSLSETAIAGAVQDGRISEIIDADITESVTATDTISFGNFNVWVFEVAPASDIISTPDYRDNEYAGTIARITMTLPRNTRLMQITFEYGSNSPNVVSRWEEIYTAPIGKMFLDPVANADLIESFIENEPVIMDSTILKNIIDMSVAKITVVDLA